jgi:hypothetical protein
MEDKTTLAQKDIRFARTIQRLQRVVLSEIQKICVIHLYSMGYRNEDLMNFSLTLNNPSKIAELQELEHLRTRFEIAGAATEGLFSKRWIYKSIFKMDDDEVERIMREQFTDSKHSSLIEAAGTAAGESATADLGGELGGEGEGELEGLEGEDLGEEEPEVEEGPLLAEPEPAQRDDWYKPVTIDKRKGMGPRKRSITAAAGEKIAYPGPSRMFNGVADGLGPLSRGIVSAGINREEDLITETNRDIEQLIKELDKRHEKQT